MNGKIDFMAGLPAVNPGAVMGVAIGQTWRNRDGDTVHIYDKRADGRWEARYEGGKGSVHTVDDSGNGKVRSRDLMERVTRVYIAGPMTGYVDLNFPAFHAAAADYRKRGCFVINPAEINGGADELVKHAEMSPAQRDDHWRNCMRNDINALLGCEMIVMLDGWTKSKGARLEHHIARELGMTICNPANEVSA